MAVKQLAYDQDARQALWAGVQKLASAVKTTLQPHPQLSRGHRGLLALRVWG